MSDNSERPAWNYKSLTVICQSFTCDKACPYCTAKITDWPLADDRWELLPVRLAEVKRRGIKIGYATLSGNGEPAMNRIEDLRFIRQCFDAYRELFRSFRLQTSGFAFFSQPIRRLFQGWIFEVTRVSFDPKIDRKILGYGRNYLESESFRKSPIILNIVLLRATDAVADIKKYLAAWPNLTAINLIILNANTLDSGLNNPYSRWIIKNSIREDDAGRIITEVSNHFTLTKSYDDRFDSYEWRTDNDVPILMYARRAEYGLRNLVLYQGKFIDYHLRAVDTEDACPDCSERPVAPIITVDGNDGTGKSTLVARLAELGFKALDRGLPTKLTDQPNLQSLDQDVYIILDAAIETCRQRLAQAGRNLNEQYHTVKDLSYYRRRFLEVAAALPNSIVLDAERPIEEIARDCILFLSKMGVTPK